MECIKFVGIYTTYICFQVNIGQREYISRIDAEEMIRLYRRECGGGIFAFYVSHQIWTLFKLNGCMRQTKYQIQKGNYVLYPLVELEPYSLASTIHQSSLNLTILY